MTLWKLITHHKDPDRAWKSIQKNNLVAIGWAAVGDMRKENYRSASAVGDRIRAKYPELNNADKGGPSLWDFYTKVKKGDLMLLSAPNTEKRRRGIVVVTGDYTFNEAGTDYDKGYPHQRTVRPITLDELPDALWELTGGNANKQPFITLLNILSPPDSSQ